jgi:hypothetical protein
MAWRVLANKPLIANALTGLTLFGKHDFDCSRALRLHDHVKQTSQPDVNWVVSSRWKDGHTLRGSVGDASRSASCD